MKPLLSFLVCLFLVMQTHAGPMKIPQGAFRIAQLEEAVKQAKEKKKALAFIGTDESITTKAFIEANEDAFKSVMEYAVLVLLDTPKGKSGDIDKLSPPFVTAIRESSAPVLPFIVIGTPAEDEVWMTVYGSELTGPKGKKVLHQTAAAVKVKADPYFASKTAPAPVLPGEKMLVWPLADGKGAYKAKFVKLDGENVQAVFSDGKEGAMELSKLTPAAVRYAKFIGGEAAPAPEAKETKPAASGKPAANGVEAWTNKDGKELQAAFVSLTGGKVKLRTAAGKEYTVALESLSAESQARAKELSAAPAPANKPKP